LRVHSSPYPTPFRSTRDRAMRPEYARRLAGGLGMDEGTALRAVHDAARSGGRAAQRPEPQRTGPEASAEEPVGGGGAPAIEAVRLAVVVRPRDLSGPVETMALAVMLQAPQLLETEKVGSLPDDAFHVPALQGVWDVMLAAGTLLDAVEGSLHPARYLEQVLEIAGETVRPLIVEIANLDLPAR